MFHKPDRPFYANSIQFGSIVRRILKLQSCDKVDRKNHRPTCNSSNIWIVRVPIDIEAMRDLALGRKTRPEAQHREELVRIVVLNNGAHGLDGSLILVRVLGHVVVERGRIQGIAW